MPETDALQKTAQALQRYRLLVSEWKFYVQGVQLSEEDVREAIAYCEEPLK